MSKTKNQAPANLAVTIQSSALRESVARAARTAEAKTTIPILACVVITADESGLRMRTTDLSMGVVVQATTTRIDGHGSVCVNARDLADTVKDLPDCPIELAVSANHTLTIQAVGRKLKIKIPGMESGGFPAEVVVSGEPQAVSAATLRRLIAATRYSMSSDDTRPHMTALKFTGDGKRLVTAATDGHRCARAGASWSGVIDVLMPARSASELFALTESNPDGDVTLRVGSGHVLAEVGNVALTLKLSDDAPPPVDRVVPVNWAHTVTTNRDAFVAALRRMSKISRSKTSDGVRLGFDSEELTVVAENPERGEGEESVSATSPTIAERLWIGASAAYLRDACAAVAEDEVELCISGELDPVLVRGAGESDSEHVVMPMRLG